jgi:urease accessory protein
LLLLLDARSPAGAQHHSGGMEAAVRAGFVTDVDGVARFCRARLHTSGRTAAAFAAAACRMWLTGASPGQWRDLDGELDARTPSEATRAASRALGAGLRRLLFATRPADVDALRTAWAQVHDPAPHHPLVLGAGTALTGGDPHHAARAAALAACTSPASAALRLLGLDPYAVHTVLADLTPEIEAVADDAARSEHLPATCAPALDLLADVHAREEARLFAS